MSPIVGDDEIAKMSPRCIASQFCAILAPSPSVALRAGHDHSKWHTTSSPWESRSPKR